MDKIETVNGYPVLAQRPGHEPGRGSYGTVIVLCWRKDDPIPFVTWEYVLGAPIQPNYATNGHYTDSIKEAGIDFESRPPTKK